MNVVLIGYRAVGKSAVGRHLAAVLGARFVDTDDLIEARAGCSIPALFASRGEPAFRALEHEVLVDLVGARQMVVATGGGLVLDPRHPPLLRRLGPVFWLTASADTILSRITTSDRPRLTSLPQDEEIATHLQSRNPLYAAAATAIIDTAARTVEQVAQDVVGALRRCQPRLPLVAVDEPYSLHGVRAGIDQVDDAILRLIEQRIGYAMAAQDWKQAAGEGVLDERREEQVATRWRAWAETAGVDQNDLENVARSLIALCRAAQQRRTRG